MGWGTRAPAAYTHMPIHSSTAYWQYEVRQGQLGDFVCSAGPDGSDMHYPCHLQPDVHRWGSTAVTKNQGQCGGINELLMESKSGAAVGNKIQKFQSRSGETCKQRRVIMNRVTEIVNRRFPAVVKPQMRDKGFPQPEVASECVTVCHRQEQLSKQASVKHSQNHWSILPRARDLQLIYWQKATHAFGKGC